MKISAKYRQAVFLWYRVDIRYLTPAILASFIWDLHPSCDDGRTGCREELLVVIITKMIKSRIIWMNTGKAETQSGKIF